MKSMNKMKTFEHLLQNVEEVHELTSVTAKGAVNQMLTARNWAIGYYIVEFEQNGQNRADYGSALLSKLAEQLNIKGLDRQMLSSCRIFYKKYPQMFEAVSHRLHAAHAALDIVTTMQVALAEPKSTDSATPGICGTASRKFETDPELLISRLSFSHIKEIMAIDDSFERFFYELECIKGVWSVRELRRQIDTKLFVRAGISKNPELLIDRIENSTYKTALSVKNIYALEFLGLNAKEEVTESDFEQAIMNHLQEFLLEMGSGFCFEARQKRILIDDEYYFIDLVLYHRILHCNVIIELKVDKFRIEYASQLNAYISYYKFEEMTEGDNPPVGILLCTEKGPKMVQYVLNGMDENLFVSKYMLQLPNREQLERFLIREMREISDKE